jgi:hypothetical protein
MRYGAKQNTISIDLHGATALVNTELLELKHGCDLRMTIYL